MYDSDQEIVLSIYRRAKVVHELRAMSQKILCGIDILVCVRIDLCIS